MTGRRFAGRGPEVGFMIEPLSMQDLVLRAAVATAMGLAIGYNRERRNKAAGLRTMALVSLGSAGLMLVAVEITAIMESEAVRVDPLRAAAGIIGGIGFLGAGSIIQSRGTVKGMTTAATIWVSSVLGIACGLGLFRLALTLFVMTVAVLVVLGAVKGTVLPDSNDGADKNADDRQG